tara:strand:+ start:1692 stop:2546 length:855 start_codon:yes stop_codon:yes gene_type:complete
MNKSLKSVIDTLRAHMNEAQLVWHNPCLIAQPSNLVTKKAYQGINRFVTAVVSDCRGYHSPHWATFNQIRTLGGKLVDGKGQGVPIIYYKSLTSQKDNEDAQERFVLRHSTVFNLDLVCGIDTSQSDTHAEPQTELSAEAEAVAARYLNREQLPVTHGRPAYLPALDTIRMPQLGEVTSTDEFYSTYFHELAHSTGHPNRLCRFGAQANDFDSREDYSKEELVAEITSAMLCHGCGVDSQSSIKNSAAYIQGWTRFIQERGDAFLSAVNQAYKARACILEGEGA